MEPLIITSTNETPNIELDAKNQIFRFSATSWPEDAPGFYKPVIDWIDEYFKNPNSSTIFEFNLEYFNTASAKQIAKILTLIKENSSKTKISIKWHYDKDDKDMSLAGARYSKLLNIDFELIEN